MNFIDQKTVELASPLKQVHYAFPRAKELRERLIDCVTDYSIKAAIGNHFEARGMLITGPSRVGKTEETKKILKEFNASKTLMPDGRPARIVDCVLSGRVTWKDLGLRTLDALGYPLSTSRTQNYIWEKVLQQAKDQGVIGIYYDECQHVFAPKATSNRIFLDSFKSMMKESRWPFMLMLSGVPSLSGYIREEEQLFELLDPISFDPIALGKKSDPLKDPDMLELNKLVFAYADHAAVDFEDLADFDFLERLDFACASRWGLVIEVMIAALVLFKKSGDKKCTVKHFDKVYAKRSGLPIGFSPFVAPDYRNMFDSKKILAMLETDSK
jgi:hypothetical protein